MNTITPTLKLYERDAFQASCDTTLCAVLADGKAPPRIALAESVFFAEGGGQPADRGTVCFTTPQGELFAKVLDVHETDGILWHTLDALPAAVQEGIGCPVYCTLDWAHRLDSMQQHSGEHILSGILHLLYGAENVGFHIGSELVRMDTNCPLTAAQLQIAEEMANDIIWQDVPIETLLPDASALAAMTYRSKKEIAGTVRIVRIAAADTCACCGTHLRSTGQVGQIKILSAEHYKGGERLSVVCGKRALTAAQGMRAREAEIGALLSAKPALTASAVQRVYAELNALKFAKQGVEHQLFEALAAQVDPSNPAPTIVTVAGLNPDGLHRLASRLCEATQSLCVALCEQAPDSDGAISCGYCLAQSGDADLRGLCKALNTTCHGRGGGKANICQGSAAASAAELADFVREYNDMA
ncbi:MAG: alanyl-tRNA editing protein [Faecalibacterium sp.]